MSDVLFLEYPKCSTCRKARKWLDAQGVSYIDRHIVEDNPTAAEVAKWHKMSGVPLCRFFNTSGVLYREQNIKEKFEVGLSDEAACDLLATNGMLVKRPLIIGDDFVLIGFREAAWAQAFGR